MSDRTNKYLQDIRNLRANGSWEAPEWAKIQANKLGCPPNHPKVIEWGLMEFINEHEALVLNTDAVIEAKVEQRLAARLREMGHKVSVVTVAAAQQASDKIKNLGAFFKNKFRTDDIKNDVADSPDPPAAA